MCNDVDVPSKCASIADTVTLKSVMSITDVAIQVKAGNVGAADTTTDDDKSIYNYERSGWLHANDTCLRLINR